MGHLTTKQPWGEIDFNTTTGQIFVREDWLYKWMYWPGARSPWSYAEKLAAHRRIDRSVWATWSNRLTMGVRSRSGRATGLPGRVPINFDVRWTLKTGHWTVTVWKMPPRVGPTVHRSFVRPSTREIELNTADLSPRGAGNDAGASNMRFVTPPHEYAHTIDNPDEYNAGSPHLADSASLVNIGGQVRARHLHLIVDALNTLSPDLIFTA